MKEKLDILHSEITTFILQLCDFEH